MRPILSGYATNPVPVHVKLSVFKFSSLSGLRASLALGAGCLADRGFRPLSLTFFVVNVAVPSLKADLKADLAETGMVIAVYALSFGASLIVGGRLGDIFGRRRIFSLGMASFAVASLLCGLAPTPALPYCRARNARLLRRAAFPASLCNPACPSR